MSTSLKVHDCVTVEWIAKRLKCHGETVRAAIRSGKLRAIRLSGSRPHYRVTLEAVREAFPGLIEDQTDPDPNTPAPALAA